MVDAATSILFADRTQQSGVGVQLTIRTDDFRSSNVRAPLALTEPWKYFVGPEPAGETLCRVSKDRHRNRLSPDRGPAPNAAKR